MRMGVLEGKAIRIVEDPLEWANAFNSANRRVCCDEQNGVMASTVFLGMDHGFFGGRPLWFETMILGGEHDGYQERYETYEEAELGHLRALKVAGFVN